MEFKELLKISGMSMKQFSECFEIPYRTVQSWKIRERNCPDYVLDLIKFRLENDKNIQEVSKNGKRE